MPLYEQYLKESNVVKMIKYIDNLLFDQLSPVASVLTFLEYCSSSGVGDSINTDLFTDSKRICRMLQINQGCHITHTNYCIFSLATTKQMRLNKPCSLAKIPVRPCYQLRLLFY